MERVRPCPEARFAVFYAMDDKGVTDEHPDRHGHYYGSLPLDVAADPQTILAVGMNGVPLPVEHGAPVRLRAETQLGYTMVKWLRRNTLLPLPTVPNTPAPSLPSACREGTACTHESPTPAFLLTGSTSPSRSSRIRCKRSAPTKATVGTCC
jgi:DMSO/TMAO reductase YedYZ molybdopterin-dependent catalytic subunit